MLQSTFVDASINISKLNLDQLIGEHSFRYHLSGKRPQNNQRVLIEEVNVQQIMIQLSVKSTCEERLVAQWPILRKRKAENKNQ